jgi:Glutathione peroxidase
MELTYRQKVLKYFYPVIMLFKKYTGNNKILISDKVFPPVSFYSLHVTLINNNDLVFSRLKRKKTLIVNTASDCGFTGQYSELQSLYEKFNHKLEIIGFPSNDFKEQEKGSDEDIAQFCKVNYGVTFPLAKKSIVKKLQGQNPVFRWLSSKELNGWNDKEPSWNFSKFLIDEEGKLIGYFDPSISPLSPDFLNLL